MQSSKTEEEMAQLISNYIYFHKGVRIKVARPQTPAQHLLLVQAYEFALSQVKKPD